MMDLGRQLPRLEPTAELLNFCGFKPSNLLAFARVLGDIVIAKIIPRGVIWEVLNFQLTGIPGHFLIYAMNTT